MDILEWPAKALDTKAEDVVLFDEELKKFVQIMHNTMDASGGIGLAANQIGVLKRVIVMLIPYTKYDEESNVKRQPWHDKRMTFINPKIISANKTKEVELLEIFDEEPLP